MVGSVGAGAQSGPATTTISDTVYSADGTPAAGTLIITWPAFVTAGGQQVAAGSKNVTLGARGNLNAALVANAGATPAGMYYSVVYQLGPGQVKTESWIVPVSSSPVNLAGVRVTPGAGVAGQPVSMQYVNSELAAKANDNAVVHLNGNETITGAKTFASVPSVPTPVNPGDVASKGYVDQAVSNVGAGNYLPTAGGTMTGPITLPGSPAAPLQATTKSYVDASLATKADLVSGLVPANELGTGQAAAGNCLTGNGTWAPCSAGGTGNLSTTPAASQTIAQPVGTQFSVNNLANIRYVTASWNWLQTPTDNLSTPGSNNVIHLSPCPLGLDTNSSANHYTYKVYIAGTGTPEAAAVSGGSCAPGTSGGTIIVATQNPHGAGYTVGSASGGIQEAWNDAWTSDTPNAASSATAPYVKLVADATYNVYATVYLRGRGGLLDGAGALIACSTRDRCIYVGTTQGQPYVHHHKLYNLTGTSSVNVDGVQVASVAATNGTYTITAASNHPFVVGDLVDCEYYSQTLQQHWVQTVTSVPTSATFTFQAGSGTVAAGSNTFGFCGLLNAFVEDNSDHVAIQDINLTQMSGFGMGMFSYGIVDDNDQHFVIERASNRSSLVIRSDANFPMGAFVYARGDQGNAGLVYVHDSEFTNVNCIEGNSGNGLVFSDSVCQGFPVYGVRYFGGYQPATFANVYQESTGGGQNPLYGYAAQMGYAVQGGIGTKFVGTFPTSGLAPVFAAGGSGSSQRAYFVVPRSSTLGYGPLIFAGYAQPTTSTTNVTVTWPSIELQDGYYHQSLGAVTWDVLVVAGQSATTPYGTGTYAIATNAAVSCGRNGMCSFTDTQATPVSYTVAQQQFTPVFWFWPNNLVINNTTVFLDAAGSDPGAVASQGTTGISIVASECTPQGASWARSPIWVSCLAGPENSGAGFFSTVLQQTDSAGNGPFANSKGRLNFGKQIGAPNDLITLADTNFLKTLATSGERPANDAGDIAIGVDQAGGLSQRAGTSISSYINVVPNGTNFLERLTSSGDTLNVPLTVNGNLTVSTGTVSLPVTGTGPQCLHVSANGVVSGTGADCGSGGGGDPVLVNRGVGSQLAMYSGNGSALSGDATLTDNGTTLSYSGTGGIAANSATLSGNLTVNGQLQVAGPWMVSSPIPGTLMSASGPGTSSLGISDDGNFYISANGGTPQQVATTGTSSYFSNLWQEDANDLGAYNGTNAQGFHVYGTTDGTNYNRVSLLYDGGSQDFLLSSDWAGSGAAHNLGLRTGSSVKWEVTTGGTPSSAFRPWADLGATIGDAFHRPQLNYSQANVIVLPNSSVGTTANYLAKAVSSGAQEQAQTLGTSDTSAIGIVVSGAGGTGTTASIARSGEALCAFDGTVTLNDYVVPSTTSGGQCHDTGSATSCPGGQVIGRAVLQTSGNNFYVLLGNDSCGGGAGAPINSPSFAGTVTLPDGTTDSASGISVKSPLALQGGTSGSAAIGVAAAAGSPSQFNLPTTDPVIHYTGNLPLPQIFSSASVTGGVNQTAWSTPGKVQLATDCTGYVSPSGSAAYPGTLAAPASVANDNTGNVAGDVICMLAGTYPVSSQLAISGNGSASAWITWEPYGNGLVTWQAQASLATTPSNRRMANINSGVNYRKFVGRNLWVIDGQYYAIDFVSINGSHHYLFDGLKIQNMAVSGISLINSDYTTARRNVIWNIGANIRKASITAWSITSNSVTFTAPNNYQTNEVIDLYGFGTSTFFNGTQVTVTSATSTTFTGAYTHANGSGTESGSSQVDYTGHGSAISLNSQSPFDSYTGIHNYIYDNIIAGVYDSALSGHTDGNGIILDLSSNGAWAGGTLIENDLVLAVGGRCIETNATNQGVVFAFNNTCYYNGLDSGGQFPQIYVTNNQSWILNNVVASIGSNGCTATAGSCVYNFYNNGASGVVAAGNIYYGGPANYSWTFGGVTNANPSFLNPPTFTTGGYATVADPGTAGVNLANEFYPSTKGAARNVAVDPLPYAAGVSASLAGDLVAYGFEDINGSPRGTTSFDAGAYQAVAGITGFQYGTHTGILGEQRDQTQILGDLLSGSVPVGQAASAASLNGVSALPAGTTASTQGAGDNSTKLATTAYVRNEQYMTYSCPVGSVGTVEQFCTWTLPAGITVTGFDLSAGTAPVGCSTYPTVQVWDGTANAEVGSFSISMTSGSNFYTQVTGNTNLAAGHALRVKTTTGQAGCSTGGANVMAVVTYQMQN